GRGREGTRDMSGQLAAELPAQPAARPGQTFYVDAGRDPEASAHPEQILGREIAAGHLGERRSAYAARARIKDRDAFGHGHERVRERLAIRVVQMHADTLDGDPRVPVPGEKRADLAGRADADRVAERELITAEDEPKPADLHRHG